MSEMTRLQPHEVAKFLRAYRFIGGRLRAVKVVHKGARVVTVEFHTRVREAITDLGKDPRHVRLRLRLNGVEEFRFQMRPSQPKSKITDARIGYHNGLFYVTLDSIGLEPGETAQVFDFRASEVFAAGRELFWEVATKGSAEGDAPKP
ncbi:hypothetical protein VT84_22750 [Gemmata sp. SH-PL17]|uniref:hypothetical protein n=1 Tax=Gemmata sp. SH-PL17 TaxID=1630693 RepID=UPI0004AF1791|nr:hypothetical protein [Gemmata sp. SH-PL17]AMV27239.1 hypothetical protein VT84_22750 [Gemmata sp. SH-PL17]